MPQICEYSVAATHHVLVSLLESPLIRAAGDSLRGISKGNCCLCLVVPAMIVRHPRKLLYAATHKEVIKRN